MMNMTRHIAKLADKATWYTDGFNGSNPPLNKDGIFIKMSGKVLFLKNLCFSQYVPTDNLFFTNVSSVRLF